MMPDVETFRKIVNKCNGNLSSVARTLGVNRGTVENWKNSSEEHRQVVVDARMKMFDSVLSTAEILALGIPERDENGKFVGWIERPDPSTVKYILGSLGKKEGFGDTLDITTNGKEIVPSIEVQIVDKREDVIADNESICDNQ